MHSTRSRLTRNPRVPLPRAQARAWPRPSVTVVELERLERTQSQAVAAVEAHRSSAGVSVCNTAGLTATASRRHRARARGLPRHSKLEGLRALHTSNIIVVRASAFAQAAELHREGALSSASLALRQRDFALKRRESPALGVRRLGAEGAARRGLLLTLVHVMDIAVERLIRGLAHAVADADALRRGA